MTAPTLRVESLGAGIQSTTMLLASIEGLLPKLDAAVFADTGREPRAVYEHLAKLEKVAADAGIPVYRVSDGNIRDDMLDPARTFHTMPTYVRHPDGSGAMGQRQCTKDYKLRPLRRWIRRELGYPHPTHVPDGVYAEVWVGFSTDEIHRVGADGRRYARNVFPLLDLGMSRRDCQRWLGVRGWGATPKSACIGCPFHGNRQWRKLRDEAPAEWADAVAFDAALRSGPHDTEQYLHRSLLPLSTAPIDRVTRREWTGRQEDLLVAVADAEAGYDPDEDGDPDGCSPQGCRSGEPVA